MNHRKVRLCDTWCDVTDSPRGVSEIRLNVRAPMRARRPRNAPLPRRLDLSWASPFQRRVLRRLARVRSGDTITYGALARSVGSSPRAVGRAVASNRLPLVFP